ncbi:MAG: hypothetical protein NZ551_01365 [Microscillaceae bacterium]|nr:hypothetical protein [Microscillaceae bacterium]MDW8459838.1 AsmA-like C-terminal region-containing protein [Cytophagales bacterium]
MKILRIFLYIALFSLLFLVLIMVAIPYFFKDDIQKIVDTEIAKRINAKVFYNPDKFSLSFFSHFPHLSLGMQSFGVINHAPFQGDTLASIQKFELSLNVWSILFENEIKVNGIYLHQPRIFAKVLPNGKANWDIMKPDTTKKEAPKADTLPTKFKASVRYWQIKNGLIVYDDKVSNIFVKVQNLTHEGNGNFTQDEFDLNLRTQIQKLTANYDGVSYLNEKTLQFDATLGINMPKQTYTFKENLLKINDFALGFEGFVQLKDTNIITDIRWNVKETQFKNLLSLVPGIYTASFKDLKTSGNLACNGFVKGTYNSQKLPNFGLKLQVKDGFFQYPTLPTAVKNVQIDAEVENKDGVVLNTIVNLKQLQANFGQNPFKAKALLQGISPSNVEADIEGKLNLAEVSQIFPVEGLQLKGLLDLLVKAKGRYDGSSLPQVNAVLNLTQGYIKSKYFPEPLEELELKAIAKNTTGKYEDTEIGVQKFTMLLEKERFEATAFFKNLADIQYDVKAKGKIVLEKITKIYPLPDMQLKGQLLADVQTQGQLSKALAGKYDQLPTQGYIEVKDFLYTSKDFPQGFGITQAHADFTPEKILLNTFDGSVGKSKIQLKGDLSNYMAYVLKAETLKGSMTLNSEQFDVNEFIPQTPENQTSKSTSSTPSTTVSNAPSQTSTGNSPLEIPKNIDFTFAANLQKVLYGKYTIQNLVGKIIIRNGIIQLDDTKFNLLGGGFTLKGLYDPRELFHPKFMFDFGINKLPIAEIFNTFNPEPQKTSRLAQEISGDFSTLFKFSGELDQNFMPKLDNTFNGAGSIQILSALIKGSPILQNLAKLTGIQEFEQLNLQDVKMLAQIQQGRVIYQPFDIQTGKHKVNVSGNNGLDGSLDFVLKLDLAAQQLNPVARNTLSALTGQINQNTERINLNLKLAGTYSKPTLTLLGANAKEMIKQAVVEKAQEVVKENKQVQELKENANQKAEEIMAQARQQAEAIVQEARNLAQKIKEEADINAQKAIEEAAKNGFLAKLAAEKVAQRGKREAYLRADNLVAEAEKRAENLLKQAQERANKVKNLTE